MAKTTTKTTDIRKLKVNTGVNVRLANNYDIPSMRQSLADHGKILDPIHARLCDDTVLKGNRRTLAGQEWIEDPNCPQELADNLKKVTVIYHDVTPGSQEEMAIILDHGTNKKLNKTESLFTVWRLDKQFLGEEQIISLMYGALADYTGNNDKAVEAAAITNLKERKEYLKKWLHGTVGNYMLAAAKMGEYVKDQMVKTHLSADKMLPAGQKVEMKCSRDRITKLSAAKTADDPKNGGSGWTYENGGEEFNALIERFKKEDRGEIEPDKATKSLSAKELKSRVDHYKNPAIRNALLVSAGHQELAAGLSDMDDRLTNLQLVMDVLQEQVNDVQDLEVRVLLKAILKASSAGEVELALEPFKAKRAPETHHAENGVLPSEQNA